MAAGLLSGHPVNITLRQLISHVSGIRTTTGSDLLHDWEFRIKNSTQILPWFARDNLLFEPGTRYEYSNHGWNLIGAVVEAVEKRSYHLVLEEYMHSLGMKTALMDTRERLVPHRGRQYQVHPPDHKHPYHRVEYCPFTDNLRPFPHWPCGGVLANVHDLLTYGRAVLASHEGKLGSFLHKSTVDEMWNYRQPIVPPEHPSMRVAGKDYHNLTSRYVLGWDRVDFPADAVKHDPVLSDLVYISHTGEIGGANAKLAIVPKHQFVMAIIANRAGIGNELQVMPIETLYTIKH